MDFPQDIALTEDEFRLLRDLVHRTTGIALRDAKLPLLRSRLMKRVRHYQCASFADYYNLLVSPGPQQAVELQEMINAVTTNKTLFFREPHHFRALEKLILAPALRPMAMGSVPSIRIWSAGCSTGEEPYSIAMTLMEFLDNPAAWDIRILATDIDTEVIEQAKLGVYLRSSVADLPSHIIRRYFLSGTGRYSDLVQIKPEIKRLVSFGQLNLIQEPWPFRRKFDAIFCRNVIIYFDHSSQRRVLECLARCLKPGGVFFAGHSENLSWLCDKFDPVGSTTYQVRGGGSSTSP